MRYNLTSSPAMATTLTGFITFTTFELRDRAWEIICAHVDDPESHCMRARSLPHIVVTDLDMETIDKLLPLIEGKWFTDEQFGPTDPL